MNSPIFVRVNLNHQESSLSYKRHFAKTMSTGSKRPSNSVWAIDKHPSWKACVLGEYPKLGLLLDIIALRNREIGPHRHGILFVQ
jgi:hypothetical protein